MASTGKAAFGATVTFDSVLVGEVKTITGPSISMEPIDITNHDSPDQFKEFVAGLSDGGEVSITGNLTTATLAAKLLASPQSLATLSITIPAGGGTATFSGSALMTKFEPTGNYDGAAEFSASFKISGKPTFTVT